MLSRTADHLFWMARYMERAENTARMLDANYQLSLLPQSDEYAEASWRAMLSISELTSFYAAGHAGMESSEVIEFMTRDTTNLSSILSCLRAARENARAVRGAITIELWETINTTWLECQRLLAGGVLERDPREFFEWVKFRSHQSRGVEFGTMVFDAAFDFMQLGTFLERADNTARILDVKFAMLEHEISVAPDRSIDYYHWTALLRSITGLEAYRKVYRDTFTPERVANMVMLYRQWPRSLSASIFSVQQIVQRVRTARSTETERFANELWAELRDGKGSEILAGGLHGYLTDFLAKVNELACRVSEDFLVPLQPDAALDAPAESQSQSQAA